MDHEHKQPTDHLPTASERATDDDRTTADRPYPVDGVVEPGGVSPDTAAEPDRPDRHGVDKLPPTAR